MIYHMRKHTNYQHKNLIYWAAMCVAVYTHDYRIHAMCEYILTFRNQHAAKSEKKRNEQTKNNCVFFIIIVIISI